MHPHRWCHRAGGEQWQRAAGGSPQGGHGILRQGAGSGELLLAGVTVFQVISYWSANKVPWTGLIFVASYFYDLIYCDKKLVKSFEVFAACRPLKCGVSFFCNVKRRVQLCERHLFCRRSSCAAVTSWRPVTTSLPPSERRRGLPVAAT